MGYLFLLAIILVVYLLSRRSGGSAPTPGPMDIEVDSRLEARNYEWAQFIANYYAVAHSKTEKGLIRRMLADISAQGLPVPQLPDGDVEDLAKPADKVSEPAPFQSGLPQQYQPQPIMAAEVASYQKDKLQVQMDNASLLLYFGAFLFVASAGLFVAFGGLPGGLRTFIVMLVTLVMYSGGLWINKNRPQLQQAALTFVGIGMAVAPLTGLAAYNYVFSQSNGRLVWLATSVLCMVLYGHALVRLRKPLISYIFIFTFLSLFESGVSIVNSPIYYFGWGMAIVGIGLSAASRIKGFWPELQEPASVSAAAFVPLSLLTSLTLVANQGSGQLGVSLLLTAAYYGLQAMSTQDNERATNAIAAQVGLNSGIAALTYAVTKSWPDVAISVAVVNLIELAVAVTRSRDSYIWGNFASIVIVYQFMAILVSIEKPGQVLAMTFGLIVVTTVVWLYQRREDAYAVAALAWMAPPLVYGLWVAQPHLSGATIMSLLAGALTFQFVLNLAKKPGAMTPNWSEVSLQIYVMSAAIVSISGFWTRPWVALAINTLVAVSMAVIARRGQNMAWSIASGLLVAVPLLRGWDQAEGSFLAANAVALLLNIGLSLRYRQEFNRWVSTALWLLLPIALGDGITGNRWSVTAYAWAYVLSMAGLVLSRAIARGVVLPSNKVPLASYARSASLSYVFGYGFAGFVATCLSAFVPEGRVHATAILSLLALLILILSRYVEKRVDILMMLPLFGQAILLSALRPSNDTPMMLVYLLSSTALALVSYFSLPGKATSLSAASFLRQGALVAVFVTPLARMFVDRTYWPMPLGLLIAGCLLYHYIRNTTQEYREMVGGIIVAAIYWFMWFWGVHALQAYTHVLVALFGLYAYWRNKRGESGQSDQYLMIMLATATIPLALQAIDGQAGGLYGWWLLLEQVVFMLIGMSIGKRFVTMWGLYVAVGAVLYQLRNLGWAALTVLAIFLIGLAIYRLQKYTNKPQ